MIIVIPAVWAVDAVHFADEQDIVAVSYAGQSDGSVEIRISANAHRHSVGQFIVELYDHMRDIRSPYKAHFEIK